MTISVVMIVRDGARFLAGAIGTVLAQTRPPSEILIVDGHSTDETLTIAARHGLLVTQQPGTGIADARNHGIASTTGRLVAFLDHDDRWLPAKLERQLDALEHEPEAGYSVTMLREIAANGATTVHPVLAAQLARGPVLGLTPSTLVVKRDALRDVGLFDPGFGLGCDTEWFVRVADLGLGRATVDEVLVEKLLHDRNASIDASASRRALLRSLRVSVRRKQQPAR